MIALYKHNCPYRIKGVEPSVKIIMPRRHNKMDIHRIEELSRVECAHCGITLKRGIE